MSDLKNCPFCGKPAKWEKKFLTGGIARCSDYQCIGAFTHLSRSASSGEWNTRPTEDAKDREIENLKAALHSVLQNAEFWDNEDDSLAIIHRIATDAIGKDTDVPANAPDAGKMEEN